MTGLVLAAGAATWLVTLILVEGHLFQPFRDWVGVKAAVAIEGQKLAHRAVLSAKPDPRIQFTPAAEAERAAALDARLARQRKARRAAGRWAHASYFVRCHLCLGTWVALVLTALPGMPRPFTGGVLGWILAALVVKAVAHLILEVAAVLKRTSNAPRPF